MLALPQLTSLTLNTLRRNHLGLPKAVTATTVIIALIVFIMNFTEIFKIKQVFTLTVL